ncbi:20931_t:CDS:2 [Rhizophagus irregularis]|nr:20931_t:CDS:2 [Rhizophagus irregularis]
MKEDSVRTWAGHFKFFKMTPVIMNMFYDSLVVTKESEENACMVSQDFKEIMT